MPMPVVQRSIEGLFDVNSGSKIVVKAAGAKGLKAKKRAGPEKPKRLTPKPDVLRELYLLSGNNCAMPDCDSLIIDSRGVVLGHVCHIEAAMPDGARFNANMTNEDRRAGENLVLMCGGHHAQIDSKQYETKYNLEKVRKIKHDHEARFKGIGDSLRQSFHSAYSDATDRLNPTGSGLCKRLEQILPDCAVNEDDAKTRSKQLGEYVERMRKVPEQERDFMLGVIRRAVKLGSENSILVHVDDVKNALNVPVTRMDSLGKAMERHGVGDIDLCSTNRDDEPHVFVRDPSEYVTWFDIVEFCDKSGEVLEDFVILLKFGLLD
jgi:hypothetical protein